MEQKVKTANELTVMKSFRDVELSAPFNVVITKSNECVVIVECDDADMDKINVRVENGALRIKSDCGTAVMKTSKRGGFFGRFFGNSIVQTQKGGDNCCQVQISANGSIVAMNGSVINCSNINGNITTGETFSCEVTVRIAEVDCSLKRVISVSTRTLVEQVHLMSIAAIPIVARVSTLRGTKVLVSCIKTTNYDTIF